MADNVELETVTVQGDSNAEDGASAAASDSSPAAANGDDCNGAASASSSARPTPDSSPRLQYQRNNPVNPAEPDRFRKRGENGAETPKRKLSLMEVEALRDRKRLGHLKEVERILAESLGSAHTFSVEHFTSVFVSPELTTHFFGLYDWDGAGYLDQEEWIEFLKGRVKTNHQRELIEVVETAAYLICGNGTVDLEKFRNILEAKGVAVKFYRIFSEKTHNHVDLKGTMDFIANLSNARPRTGFTQENMEWLEQLFRGQLGNSQELQFEDFKKIVHSKNPFFAERVFQIFDRDNSGAVSLQEFLDAMHQFAGQSHDDKIRFLFKVYDLDGDGLIQHRELQHVMHACMEENGMTFSQEQIEDLTSALFEDADVEAEGAITYEDLKAQLEKHEGLLENLSISIDRWLVPPQPKRTVTCLHGISTMKPYQFSMPYIKNNYAYLTFLVAFLAVQIGLFVARCVQFSDFPVSYIIARACGQTLNFCCAFIVAVMLRNLITLARTNGLATYLPLDEHIYFHKMAGWFIFIYSLLHTIAHFINFAVNVVPTDGVLHGLNVGRNYTYAEWLLTMRPGKFGLIHGFANPSGIALMIILAVMVICSQPFVRKKGNFEVFYYTHLLYIPYYVLLILHGPNFWKWFIVPGVIYVIERIIRLVRTKTGQGRTYISSGILLPSKVTHLVIKRPSSLDYHPGDYLFVNIPAIAKYEWHPFTISSAPEQDETLWLHIRALGGWTHRLYDYFEEEQMKLECREEAAEQDTPIQLHKNDQTSLHRIQKSIKKLANSNDKSRRISFNTKPPEVRTDGAINEGCEEEVVMEPIEEDQAAEQGDQQAANRGFNNKKQPLLKTVSLPDMEHRMKKRQKMMMLRHQMRSTSETQFDESTLEKAKTQLNNLPYLNPQNRSVAKSFRYMRRKPTIIAFKTPSSNSIETERPEKVESPETKMEEGRFEAVAMTEGGATQYPVGKPLEIYIDGPYGTPSSHIFRAQHAVLIGTGIGVTPFASILQSIMYRYWKNRHKCPRCEHQWTGSLPESVMYLKKVDFFWINRDQRSFEWFVNLLSQLEIEQAEQGGVMDRFLDMHMYITSALQKTDMKAVGLQLALDLLHEKEKRDMITGLKTRTIAGRPNWNKVFRQIQEQRKGKVTVFFCGPPALSRTLRYKCDEFGFKFRKENF